MRLSLFASSLLVAGLLISGCTTQPDVNATSSAKVLSEPAPHVKSLIEKFKLDNVTYDYVKAAIGNGTKDGAKAILIDARPNPKYLTGTIPSSLNIPDTQIDKFIGQLDKVAKDKEIIVFCGGWECEKSPIVAGHLKSLGFSNVKLYQAGEPEWSAKNYLEIGLPVVQGIFKNNSAVLMDARPYAKYMAGTIPGALFMSDDEVEKLQGRLPSDKATPIVTFCEGYACVKSHNLAKKLQDFGYTKISVYAGGYPEWKEAGMQTTAGGAKKVEAPTTPKKEMFVEGIKLGADEGTVDGEAFKALVISDKVPSNVVVVDVRTAGEYANGHIKGAINIEAGKLSPTEFAAKLPKGKVVVLSCAAGSRSMEAFLKLKDAKIDVSKIFYFDANVKCDKASKCEIKANEPLG